MHKPFVDYSVAATTVLAIHLVLLSAFVSGASADECAGVELVTRRQWGAQPTATLDYQLLPVQYVIVHHTVSGTCTQKAVCAANVAGMQKYHMERLHFDDIAYNFVIGNDGRVYEGTGWHIVGAHTFGYNRKGLGVAFIGNYNDKLPTTAALNAAKTLLRCGVRLGELNADYRLLAARQVRPTASPGTELYGEIMGWNNWSTSP